MKNKNFELADKNEELKSALVNCKNLVKEKDEKVYKIRVELENTKKNIRMLNSGTKKLDYILNMGQSMCNQNGLGYVGITNTIATISKTVFVKYAPTTTNRHVSGKNAKPPLPKVKVKRLIPIYYYCNMPSHIRPKYFKYKNIFMMNRIEQPYYKLRPTPKLKIDLDNKFAKKTMD